MAEKSRIISSLGEQKLLLPALVRTALAANDRTKYYFTLLQAARSHADHPQRPISDLHQERLATGIDDAALDAVVGSCARLGKGRYAIHGAAGICQSLGNEINEMLAPLVFHEDRPGEPERQIGDLTRRFNDLAGPVKAVSGDDISGALIDRITSGSREHGDSLHLLVMDAHKSLNKLQAAVATEIVDGASVYDVQEADRPLIRALMEGVNRTMALKFDHPGLGTSATRSGQNLVIQNDIGTTDAHVVVIHVKGLRVEVTYTDVHLQRLIFFQRLLERYQVEWQDTLSRKDKGFEDGLFHLALGSFSAADVTQLQEYLAWLGSRFVFLIDWNRARKRLQHFVPKAVAVDILKWAADHDHGHMAFLKAGAEQLVYEALQFASKGNYPLGKQMPEILGKDEATEFLKAVLKICSEGLLREEPLTFIQDAIRAEMVNCLKSGEQGLFDLVSEHAAFVVEIAQSIQASLVHAQHNESSVTRFEDNARRAKEWESRADELVIAGRSTYKRIDGTGFFATLIEAADEIADELEDAAFHLTLLSGNGSRTDLHPPLIAMSGLLVQGSQEYLKAIETARHLHRGASRDDVHDFLGAVHRILQVERRTDEAQRAAETALASSETDFKALYLASETAKNLESAADALMHCALRLRDFVMSQFAAA